MKIWVDADACPAVIKDILFRAARRTGLNLTLVANHAMRIPRQPGVDFILVPAGADVADNEIVQRMRPGDIVVTADIPLAAQVVEKGALALNPRGELYSRENVRERLNVRDFMESLRNSGIETGGPAALSRVDRNRFANQLDRLLTQQA
ncbi:MAG: YaiI/YqxD family protein [Desulfuromonadales bacterium]|nr:YaiI/YqxD family protein [Desulfuromonadales bacterium]MBN2791012.1 YaiI/YqxD family protein [Desulfuromonadales bacterium]